jgi:hypothetical protein
LSREYEEPGERSWCTDFAFEVLEMAKGHAANSLSLLRALLSVPGSVVYEAFHSLGLDLPELSKGLGKLKKEAGHSLDEESWIVGKASKRAKAEGFPLSTDHLLEVIWDEDTAGAAWLSALVDPQQLEVAMNRSRYPNDDGDDAGLDVPWGPGPGPQEGRAALDHPRSH